MKIEYSSNNSGGRWWLSDDNWKALEASGWKVAWCKDEKPIKIGEYTMKNADENGRWIGALAKKASKDFENVGDAIREWEKITGLEASDEGCNCCGALKLKH
jgi:hypothetical protein